MCFVVLLEIHLLLLLYYYIIGYTSKLIAFTMYALFLKLEELVCPQTSKISKKLNYWTVSIHVSYFQTDLK